MIFILQSFNIIERFYRYLFEAHRSSYNMMTESVKMFVYLLIFSFFESKKIFK
jgi:hypothetical protein